MTKLDTITLVETPEGIDLQAELVGLVPRCLAYSLDFFTRLIVLLIFSVILGLLGEAGWGILLVLFFILEWWYPVAYEVFRGGQTPGKKALNIKVVNEDLTPVNFGASLTRNLLRTADLLPNLYIFGALSITVSQRFQRLGDLAAGTLVVYATKEYQHQATALDHIKSVTPQHVLNEDQQAAFINFTLNRGGISNDRQSEIADIIAPALPLDTSDSADYVRGVGKWLLGARDSSTLN